MRRRRGRAIPAVAIALLLIFATALPLLTLAVLPHEPAPTPDDRPPVRTERPLGRYPPDAERSTLASCAAGVPGTDVPAPVVDAFCVCVLNRLEERFPTYEQLERARTSGALDAATSDAISAQCVKSLFGQ